MWLGNKTLLEPSSFKRELGTFAPRFGGYRQHDAQELLAFLLDGIHEDLNRVQQKPYIEDRDCDGTQDEVDAILAWKNYLRRNKSLVVDLFQGQLRNTCQGLKCKHKNIRFEPFMYLSLPISSDCKTLQDCMGLFLSTEVLRGTNQWYCEKCKQHVDATKKIDLWILPPILIVHLKRFTYQGSQQGGGSKNSANIEYPSKQWDITKDVLSKAGDPAIYDLYAVSNHLGSSGGGHYTAHALNRFDDQWYEFNDSHYRVMQQNAMVDNNPAAYVLFYNRVTDDETELEPNSSMESVAASDIPLRPNTWRRPYLPLIRRQSVSRPDLWPHTQVPRQNFRDFRRPSKGQVIMTSLSPSRKPTISTKDIEKHAPAAVPMLQKERCATS
jgi:ubiquitin carboxyl-terminal hydrolase 8